jgi:hypothetical protein
MPMQSMPLNRSTAQLSRHAASSLSAGLGARDRQQAGRAAMIGLMLPPAIIVVYLVTSALGMNLFPGHPPLLDSFYHLIR